MKLYLFDVDETLEISAGPVKLANLIDLQKEGHILGVCGNWALFARVPYWYKLVSLLGPMTMSKQEFLSQCKNYIPCDEVIMVGNILGVSGASDDQGSAQRAGVRFISEKDFAEGIR